MGKLSLFSIAVLTILFTICITDKINANKIVHVELGGHCALGAAPVGPNGAWQVVEHNVTKVCPEGSSCRQGACNCDDLSDGTVMGIANLDKGRECRRIAGEKCSVDDECFPDVKCLDKVCTCTKDTIASGECVDEKHDFIIMA